MTRSDIVWIAVLIVVAIVAILGGYAARVYYATQDLYDTIPTNDLEEIERLLKKRADPDRITPNGTTSLCMAVEQENAELLALLLRYGADPNLANETGQTPLFKAVYRRNAEMARLLLDHGAKPDPRSPKWSAPLTVAASRGNLEMVELLISHGADCNASPTKGGTPIGAAAGRGHEALFFHLIELGCDEPLDRETIQERLIYALHDDHVRIAEEYVRRGGDLTARTPFQSPGCVETLLHVAAHGQAANAATYLVENGLDPNAFNSYGETAIDVALKLTLRHVDNPPIARFYAPSVHHLYELGSRPAVYTDAELAAVLWMSGYR